jgi:prepilin-type N-terminal cleavage/methylation domain-containing protein
MNRRGFSLVELIVVIGLIAILLALATINFGSWQRKSLVERYAKELYSDVQGARMRAAYSKMPQSVTIGANQVFFRSSTATGAIITTKNLPLSFTINPGWTRIDFNTRGIVVNLVPFAKVICITTTEDAAYDALIITPALTSMGKVIDRGSVCAQSNVTQK